VLEGSTHCPALQIRLPLQSVSFSHPPARTSAAPSATPQAHQAPENHAVYLHVFTPDIFTPDILPQKVNLLDLLQMFGTELLRWGSAPVTALASRDPTARPDRLARREPRHRPVVGVELDDGPAKLQSLFVAGGEGANHWYRVSLFEGRNREVRRMFEAVGVVVSRLMRVRYGPFILPPTLKRGKVLEVGEADIQTLLADFGMEDPTPGKPLRKPRAR